MIRALHFQFINYNHCQSNNSAAAENLEKYIFSC